MTDANEGNIRATLERLAQELRNVQSHVQFSSMDGDVAYYSALHAMATCIENVIRETELNGHQ
jgi:hypothetical protein